MFEYTKVEYDNKEEMYKDLLLQSKGIIYGEKDLIANLSNLSAVLNQFLNNINWVGFYLKKGNELVLGPFQGGPACVRIKMENGVCGKAATTRKTQLVEDVHKFKGHIACDSNTNSEIVIPIVKEDMLIGVLDIDSPIFNRFDEIDRIYLEQFVEQIKEIF